MSPGGGVAPGRGEVERERRVPFGFKGDPAEKTDGVGAEGMYGRIGDAVGGELRADHEGARSRLLHVEEGAKRPNSIEPRAGLQRPLAPADQRPAGFLHGGPGRILPGREFRAQQRSPKRELGFAEPAAQAVDQPAIAGWPEAPGDGLDHGLIAARRGPDRRDVEREAAEFHAVELKPSRQEEQGIKFDERGLHAEERFAGSQVGELQVLEDRAPGGVEGNGAGGQRESGAGD